MSSSGSIDFVLAAYIGSGKKEHVKEYRHPDCHWNTDNVPQELLWTNSNTPTSDIGSCLGNDQSKNCQPSEHSFQSAAVSDLGWSKWPSLKVKRQSNADKWIMIYNSLYINFYSLFNVT